MFHYFSGEDECAAKLSILFVLLKGLSYFANQMSVVVV